MALRMLGFARNHTIERMMASLSLRCAARTKTDDSDLPPLPPKRPHTGYIKFVKEIMPELRAKQPEAHGTEIMVKASRLWNALDTTARQRLNEQYLVERKKWQVAKAEFEANFGRQTQAQLDVARLTLAQARQRRQRQQRRRDVVAADKPRRPAGSFLLFVMDGAGQRGDQRQMEFTTEMGKKWGTMSDDEKAPYVKRFLVSREKYMSDLRAWEEMMIKMGRWRLVRRGSQPIPKASEVDAPEKR